MTIATRFPKSWAVAGFDIKDPSLVLYLPLWYPYSDMVGGTIYSYDRNRRSGTVTGTTWGRFGRTFDGTDDRISLPTAVVSTVTNQLYMAVWFYYATAADDNTIIGAIQGEVLDLVINLRSNAATVSTGDTAYTQTNWTAPAGGWHFMEYQYDGVNLKGFADLAEVGTVAKTGNVSSITHLWLGGNPWNNGAGSWWLNGIIGDVVVLNRIPSLAERIHTYQISKWRYI